MLNTVVYEGPSDRTPVLIAHGLFGSARNWGAIAKRLSATRPVWAVDMRNHGDSLRDAQQDYPGMAEDLAEVITEQSAGPVDVIGHSMGGKAAMQLALTRPELVARLVVADIAPVAYGHSQAHLIDAMAALDVSTLTSRRDADEALAPAIPEAPVRAFLLQSLDLRAEPVAWKLNLPVLAADMHKIVGWPGTQGTYPGPALFLSGGASDYVQSKHRPAITALFPKAQFDVLDGIGHWLHAEAPGPFLAKVTAFLDTL